MHHATTHIMIAATVYTHIRMSFESVDTILVGTMVTTAHINKYYGLYLQTVTIKIWRSYMVPKRELWVIFHYISH